MIEDLLTASMLASGVRLATPYLYAGIGEMFGQRSGVLNLGVEGVMLMGAFSSFWAVREFTPDGAAGYDAGALAMGVLIALLVGLLMGLVTAFVNVTLQAEQGISGIGIFLFGLGMSDLLFQRSFAGVEAVNGFPKISFPVLTDIPLLGKVLFNHNLLVYIAFALVPVAWFVMNKTTFGLQIRAVGQNPEAADSMGISVARVRYATVILGGMLASVAGASLSIAEHNVFFYNMTAGQGFIAVALVYFGSWRPVGVLGGALLFSLVSALQLWVQVKNIPIPSDLAVMMPYVLTIVVLTLTVRQVRQPAALTKPYERGE